MPSFKGPQYSKVLNPKTANYEPTYMFTAEFDDNDDKISLIAYAVTDISLQALQKCVIENADWWNAFIQQFLNTTSKLFAKAYTVENINKIAKHVLNGIPPNIYPSNIIFSPKNIQISGGNFIVNWSYHSEPIIIDIPVLGEVQSDIEKEHLPDLNKTTEGIEELDINDIPDQNNSTEDFLNIESCAKFYEKQKIKEARLKAKLAVYKLHRQIDMYYNKYGSDISDLESESEIDSSDNENQDDIQL